MKSSLLVHNSKIFVSFKFSLIYDTMLIPLGGGEGTVNSPLVTQGTSQFPIYGLAVVVE